VKVKSREELDAIFKNAHSQWAAIAPRLKHNTAPRAALAGLCGVLAVLDESDSTVQVRCDGLPAAWMTPEMLLLPTSQQTSAVASSSASGMQHCSRKCGVIRELASFISLFGHHPLGCFTLFPSCDMHACIPTVYPHDRTAGLAVSSVSSRVPSPNVPSAEPATFETLRQRGVGAGVRVSVYVSCTHLFFLKYICLHLLHAAPRRPRVIASLTFTQFAPKARTHPRCFPRPRSRPCSPTPRANGPSLRRG
jgi:hypothetical protein